MANLDIMEGDDLGRYHIWCIVGLL